MLFKLAFRNVKRQISNYLIYFITVSLIVAIIFSINNFVYSDIMTKIQEEDFYLIRPIFIIVAVLLSVIIAFVLSYVTAFLLRRRKKEFGLYLTMGMTRGNILTVFMGETAVTFLLSLGFGILLGMGSYQAVMAIFINLLEVDYALGGYSATAFALTVLMVAGMFLIASVASLGYLRVAKISRLLNGDKTIEKTAKKPVLWFAVTAVAVVLLVVSLVLFAKWLSVERLDDLLELDTFGEVVVIFALFASAVILLPIGVAKSVVPLCVNRNEKTLKAKGTAVFTMRQLSGRLNANSVMAGILSFLLVIAITAPNVFLTQNAIIDARVKQDNPFDVSLSYYPSWYMDEEYVVTDFQKELAVIEKYAKIDKTFHYLVYRANELHGKSDVDSPEFCYDDAFIAESDFNNLCVALGRKPVQLNGGYFVQYNSDSNREIGDFKNTELTIGGVSYTNAGSEMLVDTVVNINIFSNAYIIVLPDSAFSQADSETFSLYADCMDVVLKNSRYSKSSELQNELWNIRNDSSFRFSYYAREAWRLFNVQLIALWLLGCLFVSAVFILLSMAMLALKMLSMLSEDKEKYKTLWRLGADKGAIFKSLFSQMFFFYFLPFALPFILSVPISAFLLKVITIQKIAISWFTVFGQVIGFTGVILALYALYFTVTYLIARQDIKKTLQSVG